MSDESEEELRIIEERGNSKEQNLEFAVSINEPIEKIFYKDPVIVFPDIKVAEAINHFIKKDVGCVLVVERNTNKLIGIFTERDVIRKLTNKGFDFSKETVNKYMTKDPDALLLSDPIAYALNRMAAGGYRHIPLVDENYLPIGILSVKDIIEHLADHYLSEIVNLPPSIHAKPRLQEGG